MKDLGQNSNGCSWPNGQYYNSFFARTIADAYRMYDKDGLKRTMLEHEAMFQNQVSELHRLYRIQRNLMDEVKNKELHKSRILIEPLSSSSLLASQITTEVAQKRHIPNLPVANSVCGRPSIFGPEDAYSPLCSMKGSSIEVGKNGVNSKDVEVLECRPTKVRRKLFDLELPADEYIDTEEVEQFRDDTTSGLSSYHPTGNGKIRPDSSISDAYSRGKNSLTDLNEPIKIEETNGSSYSHFVRHDPYHGGRELSAAKLSMLVQTRPFLCSPPSNGNFGEKWPASGNSRLNPGFGRDFSNQNGFHYGSLSGSKELAIHLLSTNYDYVNGSNVDKEASEQFSAYGSNKPYNCSNGVGMKSANDVNLNVVLSSSRSSNEPVSDHLSGLPWLRTNPAYKNEAVTAVRDFNVRELSFSRSSPMHSTDKNETINSFDKIFTQNVESVSPSNNADASRSEINECRRDKKILGVPIFEKHYVCKNESSFTSPYVYAPQQSKGEEEAENKARNVLLDINLPCDASQDIVAAENSAIEKETDTKLSSFRHQFDLNSCADEEEASFIQNVPSTCMRMTGEIDLEAPFILEPEDVNHQEELSDKAHELLSESVQIRDDCLQKSAAEAIVAISSFGHCSHFDDAKCNSSEIPITDPLSWFVETVTSFGEDLESKFETIWRDNDGGRDEPLEDIDYFESMVLKLEETKEDDYMHETRVPENLKVEETGTTTLLTTRTRKGQGKRGRQRRDFQRDILPGLTSLSRLEVTQDLHAFEGLMKATGHSWQSGLTRRNSNRGSCGRGRRRSITTSSPDSEATLTHTPLMHQLNDIESGLDDRSLTGWGKTSRRPRRQRCHAGNLPSIALT